MGQKGPVMAKTQPASEVLPGTVFTARQVRMLKWAVIVMGLLLVGGFAFVMSAIVYQASNLSESSPAAAGTPGNRPAHALKLPAGAAISHMALGDNRLAVHLQGPGGEEIRVIDLGTGALVGRFPLARE
jgi:hypothetical protein